MPTSKKASRTNKSGNSGNSGNTTDVESATFAEETSQEKAGETEGLLSGITEKANTTAASPPAKQTPKIVEEKTPELTEALPQRGTQGLAPRNLMKEFVGAATGVDPVPKSRRDIERTFHSKDKTLVNELEEEEPFSDQSPPRADFNSLKMAPESPPALKRRTRAEILAAMNAKKKKPPVDYKNNRLKCFFLSQSKVEIAYVEAGVNNFPAYLRESVACLEESQDTRLSLQVDVIAKKADPTDYSRAATFAKSIQAKDMSGTIGSPAERRINVFQPIFVRLLGSEGQRNDDKTKAWARNLCKFFTMMQNNKASYPRDTVFQEHIIPRDHMAYLGAWITIQEAMDVARLYYDKTEEQILGDDSILRSLWGPTQIAQVKQYYRHRGTVFKDGADGKASKDHGSSVLEALGLELEDM